METLKGVPTSTRGYPGEHNKTHLKGFVQLKGTCGPLSGLHVLIAIQTFYSVRLDNLVWLAHLLSEAVGFGVCLEAQSQPDSGLGSQLKVLKRFEDFASSLIFEQRGL